MEDAWTRKGVVASEQSVEVDDIRKLKKALWSKIDSHMKSKNHQNCVHVRDIQQQNIFHKAVAIQEEAIQKRVERNSVETLHVFNAAYFLAKEDMAFLKHPKVLKLLQKCGVQIGSMLFSDHAAADFVEHIAT